jgi:hypothetical protein
MAIIRRVTRIANPRKTKARRTAVKARRTKKHRVTRNPVLLEFGVLNPRQKRRKSVAKKRRKAHRSSNPRRHAVARVHHRRKHHKRRNPMTVVHNRRHRRRSNPMGFGSKQLLEMSGGMLIGVAAAKYIPTLIPGQVLSAIPASSFTAPVVTAIGTGIASYLAAKFLPGDVAKGVALGGSALVLSQVLNVVAPPNISGPLALAGIGDIVPTMGFSVPDRAMRAPVIQMASQGVSGYGSGNYRRMIR